MRQAVVCHNVHDPIVFNIIHMNDRPIAKPVAAKSLANNVFVLDVVDASSSSGEGTGASYFSNLPS